VIILSIIPLWLLFGKLALMLLLTICSIGLGYWTTLSSKFVPHVTLETMSIISILSGFLISPEFGFWNGLISAFVVYVLLGIIKLNTLINSVVIGLGGYAGGYIAYLPYDLVTNFAIAIVARAIIGIIVFWKITPDKVEAMAHAVIDPIFNIGIYMPVFFQILVLLKNVT